MNEIKYGADGFPDSPTLEKVAAALQKIDPKLEAFVQHMGGGAMSIQTKYGEGGYLLYAPVDDFWMWSVYDADYETTLDGVTDVPAESEDVDVIVQAYFEARENQGSYDSETI